MGYIKMRSVRVLAVAVSQVAGFLVPRVIFSVLLALVLSGNWYMLFKIIEQGLYPIFGEGEYFYASITGILLLTVGWTVYGIFVKTVRALGFQTGHIQANSISAKSVVRFENTQANKGEEPNDSRRAVREDLFAVQVFRRGDPLRALEFARERLQRHVAQLQSNAVVNLISAIVIAAVGIAVLGSAFLEIEKYRDANVQSFKTQDFIVIAIVPRLTISLFLQIFAYFFLITYRSNLNDVKFFQNETTNLDCHAAAVSLSVKNNISPNQRFVISSLLKIERNRLMGKNQKKISDSDDEKILLTISQINHKLNTLAHPRQEDSRWR